MSKINPVKAGLVLGAAMGLFHLSWAILVASGWAQRLIDFIFWMHFIRPVFVIEAFDPTTALILIVVTAIVGFIMGGVFGALWNWFHQRS